MAESSPQDRLDRHALVMAIWTPAVVLSAILLHLGITANVEWWIAAGFGALIAGFVGHVIVIVVLRTGFSVGETVLGAALFASMLLVYFLTMLLRPAGISAGIYWVVGLGLMSLVAAVVGYMIIAFGPRGAFERFDIIRNNNPRPASRLPHRGRR